ncbi:MAG TPA: sugar transferase [Candidatus Hydrogenedentes bacterium]|nr:sugar transferase [Candidatus Hydrogenedentota bacterium]HPC17453.1 sugar transferase [Candidatus Hydrogenedentota bacterium]HRT20045.1 sugar transferase [Candidatus Hydrogenedentota bacterium]HRT64891.1 sugar transferase [Candidatus Hydrogenedentota bacterium]
MPALSRHAVTRTALLAVTDTGAVLLAVLAAITLTQTGGTLLERIFSQLPFVAIFLAAWFAAAFHEDLFASQRKEHLIYPLIGISKAVVMAFIFAGFATAFLTQYRPTPPFLVSFGVAAWLFIGGARIGLRIAIWTFRKWGFNPRNVLIVGANPRTKHLLDEVMRHARYGYRVLGIVEDDPQRVETLREYNLPHLGEFRALERLLTEQVVDEVHVCLPVRSSYELIQSIAHLCVGVGVPVRLVADLFPLRLATSRAFRMGKIPMLSLSTVPESTAQLAFKRLLDIVVSLSLLIGLSPFFLLVAILIKLESPGPVFFLQERVGMNQRRFKIYKFRSMVADAEEQRKNLETLNEADGPVFKIRNDPRITRVGRFIRKYSIDELPQLINVLRGEMSLVGPRPPIPAEVEQYTWDQRRRLSVKPGMTGLWQVSGRSDLSFKEWVELDLRYIDSWSIWEDFAILLKTFRVVIEGRGAA